MERVTPERPPARSGFCNPSWRLTTEDGRASHARCRKDDCPCTCGHRRVIRHDDFTDQRPIMPGEYGTWVGPSTIEGVRPYAWFRRPDGQLVLRPDPNARVFPEEFSIGPGGLEMVRDPTVPRDTVLIGPRGGVRTWTYDDLRHRVVRIDMNERLALTIERPETLP